MSIIFNKLKSPTLGLDSELTFGKYKGSIVKDVCFDDPDYLRYLVDTGVKVYPSVLEILLQGYEDKYAESNYYELDFTDVPF